MNNIKKRSRTPPRRKNREKNNDCKSTDLVFFIIIMYVIYCLINKIINKGDDM